VAELNRTDENGMALGTAEFKDRLLLDHLTDPKHRA
jgi:hypothetical protein